MPTDIERDTPVRREGDADGAFTTVRDRLIRLVPRPRRLRLTGLPKATSVVVVLGALLMAVLSIAMLANWNGPSRTLTKLLLDNGIAPLDYQPWVIVAGVFGGGVALACLGLTASRTHIVSRSLLSVLVLLGLATELTPVLVLDHHQQGVYFLLLAIGGLGLFGWTRFGSAGNSLQVVLLLAPCLVMTFIVLKFEPSSDADPVDFYHRFSAYYRAQLLLVVGAGALVSTLIFVRFGSALATKHRRIRPLLNRDVPLALLGLVVTLKVAYVVLRYLGFGGDYLGDADFWKLRSGLTWAHASVVASVVLAVVLRSEGSPVADVGRRIAYLATTVPIMVIAFCSFVFALAIALVGGLAVDAGNDLLRVDNWLVDRATAIEICLLIAVCVGAVGTLRITRVPTAGHLMVMFTAVWVLPFLVGSFGSEHGWDGPTFWAVPEQVDAALTLLVCLTMALQLLRSKPLPSAALVRLLVVPALLINLASVVPGDWGTTTWRIALVVATVVPIAWTAPRVAADPSRQLRIVTSAVGIQLGLLVAAFVAVEGVPEGQQNLARSQSLALLWIALPTAAILCVRLRPWTAADPFRLTLPRWARVRPTRPLP
jgi:hypothetical protein